MKSEWCTNEKKSHIRISLEANSRNMNGTKNNNKNY